MLPGTFAAPKTSNLVTNTDITALQGKVPILSYWRMVPGTFAAKKII
jgi:hypothetical protein